MARTQNPSAEASTVLAQNLVQALLRERVIPRFVDSYVVENGRHALQVHASLYRDLLTILQREALLAACVKALEIATTETLTSSKGKQRVVVRKGAETFRRKFLSSLARQQGWNAGDALDSAFLEKARLAASRALANIEEVAAIVTVAATDSN